MAKLERVLVIDDSLPCIAFITLTLEAVGGVSIFAETAATRALERIRNEGPDLILLDIKMPDLDGFDVLASVRGEGNAVPVVMLTGSSLQSDVDRAYSLGCNGYFQKPASIGGYRSLAATVLAYWRRGDLPARRA